jgi:hypothetical protein
MPAHHARAGCIWCAFFRTASRRSAVIRSSNQSCRRHQREDGRCERIPDRLIAHDRVCVITCAAPAAVDRRVCRLPLNTEAGGLEEIQAFIAEPYCCEAWACVQYHPRPGLANPNQSAAIWPSFTHHTHKNRVQQSGSNLLAVADRRVLRDCPDVWYERNQAFDVYCINAERDSNAASRRRDNRV